jgi:hypothetical protein
MTKLTLADFEATSVSMELVHPTKGAIGVTLEVTGPDSPAYRNLQNGFIKRRIASDATKVDVDEVIEQNNELLATCVLGWSDDEFFGEPFSKAAMLKILRNVKAAWIRDQLNAFTDDRKNFFR